MCHVNPIILISFQKGFNQQHWQYPHYGGRDYIVFKRSHPAGLEQKSKQTHRKTPNHECATCISTNLRRHFTKIFQVEQTHQSNCILQVFHKQLQKSQGQKKINYPHDKNFVQALTCCVKIVQQFTYAQEKKNLMHQQDVESSRSREKLHSLLIRKFFSQWKDVCSKSCLLIK